MTNEELFTIKKVNIPKIIAVVKDQWLFILLIILAFIVGYFIGIVRWNIICQNLYQAAVDNLSCMGVYGPKLVDYGINVTG